MSVTAIVSAYYAEPYLAGRLDNLMAQTKKPQVVIVCQTGSAEEKIALKYYRGVDHEFFTIISTPDIPTIYAAWNAAIEFATGEFITNANCDDRLFPRALEEMEAALKRKPRYAVVYGNQEIVKEIGGAAVNVFVWKDGGYDELLHSCFIGPMPMWRRSLHDKYGFFNPEYRSAGDYEFWLRIAKAGERFLHFKAVVGQYLDRDDSAEHRQPLRSIWETARARARYAK